MKKFENVKRVIIVVLATIIISVTLISFQKQTQDMVGYQLNSMIYDNSFISTMNNMSKDIRGNVETSAFMPFVAYFASRSYNVETSYGIKTESELVEGMKKRNYTYLAVFENNSDEDQMKSLFSDKLQELDKDFQRINNYSTDNYKIRLYKMKGD